MPRPMKCRTVSCDVPAVYFKPRGIPMRDLEEVTLELDEVEALRLADVEEMYQADAALQMGVSRQTFGNIIARAHKKVATAILNGMALRISDPSQTEAAGQMPSCCAGKREADVNPAE